MNLEHHHRRIRRKAHLIHWGLAPLALAAFPAWLYFSYRTCMEDGDAAGSVCRGLRVIPFLPSIVAVLVAAFIVWDLIKVGHEAHVDKTGERTGRRLRHARHGYHAIDRRHQKHVHWALIEILAVTFAVAGWIAWQAYSTTH